MSMKRRAQSPLLDEERPRYSKKLYREDDLRDTQVSNTLLISIRSLTDAPSGNGSLNVRNESTIPAIAANQN